MNPVLIDNVWRNFILRVREIDSFAANQLLKDYAVKYYANPNSYIHANPAEMLRRLFSWGPPGSVTYMYWSQIYVALGGVTPVEVQA